MTVVRTRAPGSSGPLSTVRRGLALSPELRRGLAGTLALGLASTAGKVAVPVALQQGIDTGLRAPGGPDLPRVLAIATIAGVLLLVTTLCAYLMNVRLYTASETALAGLRVHGFRHIHDLSMLHQQAERRGALVSRVTTDIDQISQFLQFGGIILVVSAGQLVLTTVIMLVYSWQLTLVVCAAFVPMALIVRVLQRRLTARYAEVRVRIAAMLGVVAESVVGAAVIRAYGAQARTSRRLDETIDAARAGQTRAQRLAVMASQVGEATAAVAMAGAVVVGVLAGVGGGLRIGELTAFLFLVTLFVQPVQVVTEVLNDAQNAVAGWQRVLDVLDTEPDVADPGAGGEQLPPGPIEVTFRDVQFAYPAGPPVLSDVDFTVPARSRVAVVGETGSGKTTLAKLMTRLMDPTRGQVLLCGVDLTRVSFDSLRGRVVMVPQDGWLFAASIADNVRLARPEATDEQIATAFTDLGLAGWLAGLPQGIASPVGERGEELSVGERQLVALVRAYVADPDLLVLDEATSAVDPATEVRLQHALDAVTRGRTTVVIAHRLSTARAADEVVVVDRGRVVQRGPHATLVADPDSVYGRLYASWLERTA